MMPASRAARRRGTRRVGRSDNAANARSRRRHVFLRSAARNIVRRMSTSSCLSFTTSAQHVPASFQVVAEPSGAIVGNAAEGKGRGQVRNATRQRRRHHAAAAPCRCDAACCPACRRCCRRQRQSARASRRAASSG